MKNFLSILIFVFLISCDSTLTGYNFQTIASYEASDSNLQIKLTSIGNVPAGADIGEGKAIGTITSSMIVDTIFFEINSIGLLKLSYQKKKIEISDSKNNSEILFDCFDNIGYENYNKEELKELAQVIKATTYGPKGTYLEGQTDLIKVVNVKFEH